MTPLKKYNLNVSIDEKEKGNLFQINMDADTLDELLSKLKDIKEALQRELDKKPVEE